ncbi:MAG: hypothetical protein FJ191_00035 [Gammaproteobacteria bacterium]|nr:hypothetical protein [Gammaproteobacteria bacterium]
MRAEGPGQAVLLMLEVAGRLAAAQVDYAVIGAMAAAVHGAVRASLDVDAIVGMPAREAATLRDLLASPDWSLELRLGDDADPIPALLAVTDGHGNRVDLLIGLRGLDPAALSRARPVEFRGQTLRVVGLEDFIAMKAFAGAAQDLSDARQAIAAGRDSLDADLLRQLARRFGGATAQRVEELLAGSGPGNAPH